MQTDQFKYLKKIVWFSQNHIDDFVRLNRSLLDELVNEMNNIEDVEVLSIKQGEKFYSIQLGYKTNESHTKLNYQFYINGALKETFKKIMAYTKQNELSFCMSALKERTLHFNQVEVKSNILFRHYFYEIRPEGGKFFAQTSENKKSFDYFDYILFLEQTLSMVIYYDFHHRTRYFQTFFENYDSKVQNQIIEDRKKHYEYNVLRHEYNKANNIIYSANGEYSSRNPLYFWPIETEFFKHAHPLNLEYFPIRLFDC